MDRNARPARTFFILFQRYFAQMKPNVPAMDTEPIPAALQMF